MEITIGHESFCDCNSCGRIKTKIRSPAAKETLPHATVVLRHHVHTEEYIRLLSFKM